jgi:menaquinone-dependent protoporphyrinogen oxidase
MKLLIIYSTVYGQSERVARRIEDTASELAVETTVRNVSDATAADLEACGSVVIVASVLYGHHSRAVRRFVKANRARLAAMRSAFVSVSGSAVDAETRPEAEKYVRDFFRTTGWTPTRYELAGGAVNFTRYNPLIRWVTKRAMAAKGKTLDTHRDYEFTDWDAVTRFARAFVA